MQQRYLTITQLSAKLGGRSRSSIYRDIECQRLPQPIRFGGRVYFVEEEVEQALSNARESLDARSEALQ